MQCQILCSQGIWQLYLLTLYKVTTLFTWLHICSLAFHLYYYIYIASHHWFSVSTFIGRGAAMIIESLRLFYHIDCFKCCVCHVQLGDGLMGTDVRVRNNKLHCHNCYSSDDGKYLWCAEDMHTCGIIINLLNFRNCLHNVSWNYKCETCPRPFVARLNPLAFLITVKYPVHIIQSSHVSDLLNTLLRGIKI